MDRKDVLDEFETWLTNTKTARVASDYKSHVNSISRDILNNIIPGSLPGANWSVSGGVKINQCIETIAGQQYPNLDRPCDSEVAYNYYVSSYNRYKQSQSSHKDWLDIVVGLLNEGDAYHALYYSNIAINLAVTLREIHTDKNKIQKRISALRLFQEFLQNKVTNITVASPRSNYINERNINKGLLPKIDGIAKLASILGAAAFIKEAIEQSYFFSPDLVEARMQELCNKKCKQESVPARKSTKDAGATCQTKDSNNSWIFKDNSLSNPIPIVRDKDGNQAVRQLINEKTGYTVAQGKDSIFQNYIISHIWGRAYDPRYFTNLWNIVIIPAWANSLMDKDSQAGTLASKLKATFMQICADLYFKNIDNGLWGNLSMGKPKVQNPKDVVKQNFKLNIINGIDKGNYSSKIGKITRQ